MKRNENLGVFKAIITLSERHNRLKWIVNSDNQFIINGTKISLSNKSNVFSKPIRYADYYFIRGRFTSLTGYFIEDFVFNFRSIMKT